ncbi:MAG: TldD/PmbA family protein [Deltaproteobacteria bacterium]|nr:TldD/PmbA family protein [Deltaproteobacteria bacterium]
MISELEARFRDVIPSVQFCSLRFVRERQEHLEVRRGVLQPVERSEDVGVMFTVIDHGGVGYAATSDLTPSGLSAAARRAAEWARATRTRAISAFANPPTASHVGSYASPVERPWASLALGDKIGLLSRECARLAVDDAIVDWSAGLWHVDSETLHLTTNGGRVHQALEILVPELRASANRGDETQTRTFAAGQHCRQGGLEILDEVGYFAAAPRVAAEALELLDAPDCPSGVMDLILAPDQMILQIHESIGHPLELDRILGDERNYAGRSFVTPDMIGSYRYGSELLNVTFDPTRPGELASYAFDDVGQPATRELLIQDGLLVRSLGGLTSQVRSGLPGVANSRATSWNRAPIDRMANLNLEPGTSTFAELVGAVESGVYMETNCSWSIDDSRNKFQFGCERARLIRDGELGPVLKNPNYRGVSATFWRNLAGVGDASTVEVLGTPYCGKGEPNQTIRVGHASPPCRFTGVDVFGGA